MSPLTPVAPKERRETVRFVIELGVGEGPVLAQYGAGVGARASGLRDGVVKKTRHAVVSVAKCVMPDSVSAVGA